MRVIATAGHVDHGKSTLVRALTGINPDRLREEQQRDPRHLATAGDRQRAREVPRARQCEELARVGEDDREEAGDQAEQADPVDEVGHAAAGVDRDKRVDRRVARAHDRGRAAAARSEGQHQRGEDEQHAHAGDQAARHVLLGIARLLGAEELTKYLAEFRASILQTVARMPVHQDFVNQYCKASNSVWN